MTNTTNQKATKDEIYELVKEIRQERYEEEAKVTESTTKKVSGKKELKAEIEDVFLAIKELLLEGVDVPVGDIGTFKVKDVAGRKGINPLLLKKLKEEGVPEADAKKQAQIEIKPTRKVSFTQSSTLKKIFKAEQA